jgi:hypothetical protein
MIHLPSFHRPRDDRLLQTSGDGSFLFDSTIAAKLTQAAESVRMTLRDHIILADEQYFSFAENKKL